MHSFFNSSALDTEKNVKVAIKKLTRPFQSAIHARRTFREIKMLKHMNHENVSEFISYLYQSVSLQDLMKVYIKFQSNSAL